MTIFQRIIKFFAMVFAICLVISIIYGIISAVFGIIGITNIFKNEKRENIVLDNMKTISYETKVINSLDIEIKTVNMQIIKGNKFEVKTNNLDMKYSINNGKAIIKENRSDEWFFGNDNEGELIITIPQDDTLFENVSMNISAGDIKIDYLNTKKLDLKLGAGNLEIYNLYVTNETKIKGGAGNILIDSGSLSNLDLNLGMGKTEISAEVDGNNKIDAGIGNLDLKLKGNESEYKFDIDKGLGTIRFNESKVNKEGIFGEGNIFIKINGGLGNIDIKTN